MKRRWLWLSMCALAGSIVFSLAGCGGGGGGDTQVPAPAPQAALTISGELVTSPNFTAPEGQTEPITRTFTVSNTGTAGSTLAYTKTVTGAGDWLQLSGTAGNLDANQSDVITATVTIGSLTKGTYEKVIRISGADTFQEITVTLNIGDPLQATIAVKSNNGKSPAALEFSTTLPSNPQQQTLTLINSGNAPLVWTIDQLPGWVSVSPASNTLPAQNESSLVVTITAPTTAGTYDDSITIRGPSSNGSVTVPVKLTVKAAPASQAKAGNVFIGGSANITQLSSLAGAKALSKANTDSPPPALADAKVTIRVIKPNGEYKDQLTRTNDKGAYSIQTDATEGDTITVTIEKSGFTSYSKTIKVKAGDLERQFTVSGNVAAAETVIVPESDGVFGLGKASENPRPGFRFGLMRTRSGERIPFGSANELRAASNDAIPDLDMSIPKSWAPDATSLTAQLASFDPADTNDRRMFPGEFVGVGGGTAGTGAARATETTPSFALESISFFETNVTPNNGQTLTAARATGVNKAAADPVIIIKWIPQEGCGAMQKYKDREPDKAGIQVPLYTYNPYTGKWGYLGEGTLKKWNGASYDLVEGEVVGVDGKLTNLACGQTQYYFEIIASEWYDWWNLDYPLLFEEPQPIHVTGRVVDQNGQAVAGAFVEADGYRLSGSSYFYTYSDNNGEFDLELMLGDSETADNYLFTAYSYATWPAATNQEPITPPAGGGPVPKDITISDGLDCSVTGKILEDVGTGTSPVTGAWISAWTNDGRFWNWAQTGSDGSFTMKSVCDKPLTIWAWDRYLSVNVNNKVPANDPAEKTDTQGILTLKDIVRINNPPEIWSWFWPEPVKANQPLTMEASSWDMEGDYPITSSLSVKNSTGGTVRNLSGSDWLSGTWTPQTPGAYTIEVTATDSRQKSTTKTSTIEVVPVGNTPPVIYWTWVEPGSACGFPVFHVEAFDAEDGYLPKNQYSFSFSAGNPEYSATLDGWVPTTDPGTSVVVTATDLAGGQATTTLVIPAANGLYVNFAGAWPNPAIQWEPTFLSADAWQDDGSLPTYTWTVRNSAGQLVATAPEFTGDNSNVTFVPNQAGDYSVDLSVSGTCGEAISRNFTVTVNPSTIAVTYRYVQYQTYESTADRFWAMITLNENGLPLDASSFVGGQLLSPSGTFLATGNLVSLNYLNAYWEGGQLAGVTPTRDSGLTFDLSGFPSLPEGDYTFSTTLSGGQVIVEDVYFPGQTALSVVASASMSAQRTADGGLDLSWAAPTESFDQYRVIFYGRASTTDNYAPVFYGRAMPGTTQVTVPATIYAQILENAGLPSTAQVIWRMETRKYQDGSMYARSHSNWVQLPGSSSNTGVIVR